MPSRADRPGRGRRVIRSSARSAAEMVSHRDKVLEIFEKRRRAPGAPYDEAHFLDFLLQNPKKKRAVYNSFRGLRRFNAFIDEVQSEFAICFSMKDREANYSLEKFFGRVKELQAAPRSSLASLKNRMQAGPGWGPLVIADGFLLVAAIGFWRNVWVSGALAVVAAVLTFLFLRFAANEKSYHSKLLAKIENTRRDQP